MNVILTNRSINRNSVKLARAFSSGGNNTQEKLESMFDEFLKRVEIVQEEYFTSDKKPTQEEVHQEVLRSAYLARYALDQTLDKMSIFTNTFTDKREEFDVLKGNIESEALKQFGKALPENKTRPSMLQPFCHGLALAGALASPLLGQERSFKFLKTVEDAVQEEQDEMLRLLNNHKINDKRTRQLLVKTRDAGYDFFNDNFPKLNTPPTDENDFDKNMRKATKYFTKGLIRLSRHI
mmetsp:Transcript_13405/g.11902  ORF Transcript_13405/g.11902 Transcript_13405/m.11902 type:complete len:237 (-) Transcript_13405:18-728(-)